MTNCSRSIIGQDWYFAFGFGQGHDNCYVVIFGTLTEAREEMIRKWGYNWCMVYSSAEKAGVEEYNLKLLK